MTGSMQETFVGDCSRFAAGRHGCTSSTQETSVGDFRHFTVGRTKSRCSSRRLLLATAPVSQRAAWHTCPAGGSLASSAMSAPHCDAASWLRRLSGAAADQGEVCACAFCNPASAPGERSWARETLELENAPNASQNGLGVGSGRETGAVSVA